MAGRLTVKKNGTAIDVALWNARRTAERVEALDAFGMTNLENDLLKKIGVAHRKQMRQQFSTEGDTGGEAWLALDPDYAAKKRAAVGRKKILNYDGTMRKDATSESARGYIQEVKKVGKRIVINVGLDNKLARIHTKEGVRRRTDKPVRKGPRRGTLRPWRFPRMGLPSAAPRFTGSYEFVKRSVIQKTVEQIAEFKEIARDYFHRRVFEPLATGLGLKEVPGS